MTKPDRTLWALVIADDGYHHLVTTYEVRRAVLPKAICGQAVKTLYPHGLYRPTMCPECKLWSGGTFPS